MEIGERIRKTRNKMNFTQLELAKKVGVNQSTFAMYETNRRSPSADVLNKLSIVLGVSLDYLVKGEKSESSQQKNQQSKKTADLADKDTIFTYEGRQIPPEDLEYMKRLLRGAK